MTSKYCLVTGGAGFIGCAVSASLAERYGRLVVVDDLHPQVHPKQVRPAKLDSRAELYVEDVSDPTSWDRIFSRENEPPTAVVHLAAETGTGQSLKHATRHGLVNVVGTTAMLDAFARRKWVPSQFVLAGTRAVYGEGAWRHKGGGKIFFPEQRSLAMLERGEWDIPDASPMPQDARFMNPAPVSVYGATKNAQEQLLKVWVSAFGSQCTVLRFQNVYGPGQSLSNPYTGILPFFGRISREKKSIPLFEDGQMLRDFVAANDVARAIICALSTQRCNGTTLTVDIGSGVPTTISEVAAIIAEHYGAPKPHVSGQYRLGDVRHAHCSIDLAKETLGWTPEKGLSAGLRELCEWVEIEMASL